MVKYRNYGNIPTKCKKKDGYSSQINLSPSNCQSTAANFRHANGQAQAYGADFLLKKCQCETGVATAQDERRLLGLMRTVRNQYIAQGGASSDLGAMPTKCGRISENTNRASFNNEFNTDLNAANRAGRYTKEQGLAIVNQLANQLKQYDELNKHTSPEALLDEYNKKTKEIENLQEEYQIQSFDYGYATGESIGNDIINKNYSEAVGSTIGFFQAQGEMKKQKELVRLKKQQLADQQKQQFNLMYNNLITINEEAKLNSIKMAAIQRKMNEEAYYLALVNFYDCKIKFASNNFSYTSTSWANPYTCGNGPVNSFHTQNSNYPSLKDELINIVARKLELYEKTKAIDFIESASLFQSKLITIDETCENLIKLAKINININPFLSVTSLQTAELLNPDNKQQIEIEELLKKANYHSVSLLLSSLSYDRGKQIESFYQSGLFESLKINNKTLYEHLIVNDEAEYLLKLLNIMYRGKSEYEKKTLNEETIILISKSDAINSMKALHQQGLELNFKYKETTPIDIAIKYNSSKCIYYINSIYHEFTMYLKDIENKKYDSWGQLTSSADSTIIKNGIIKYINGHKNEAYINFILEYSYNELVRDGTLSNKQYTQIFESIIKTNNLNAYNNETLNKIVINEFQPVNNKIRSENIIELIKSNILPLDDDGYFLTNGFWLELYIEQSKRELTEFYDTPRFKILSRKKIKQHYTNDINKLRTRISNYLSNNGLGWVSNKPNTTFWNNNDVNQLNNLFLFSMAFANDNNLLLNYLLTNYNYPINDVNLFNINYIYGALPGDFTINNGVVYGDGGLSLFGIIDITKKYEKSFSENYYKELVNYLIKEMTLHFIITGNYPTEKDINIYLACKRGIILFMGNSSLSMTNNEKLLNELISRKKYKDRLSKTVKKDLKYWQKILNGKDLSTKELQDFTKVNF